MNTKCLIVSCGMLTLVTACTNPVDENYLLDGPAALNFQSDVTDCKTVSQEYDPTAVQEGRIIGGMLGAGVGALDAEDGETLEAAIITGAIGAAVGGIDAMITRDEERREVVIRCLQGRGHRVIG